MKTNDDEVIRLGIDTADATAQLKPLPFGKSLQLSFGGAETGTATAGSMAIRLRASGAAEFEDASPAIVIDIAAPITYTVLDESRVAEIEVTLSGFTGTATEFHLVASTYVE